MANRDEIVGYANELLEVEKWPEFAHPLRPEFLLTLPHRHRTSGFFIARLRRAGA